MSILKDSNECVIHLGLHDLCQDCNIIVVIHHHNQHHHRFCYHMNSNRHRNFEIGNFNLNSNYFKLFLGECNFWIYVDYIYYMSFQCVKLTQHGRRYVT